jgi:hypothetical protein
VGDAGLEGLPALPTGVPLLHWVGI